MERNGFLALRGSTSHGATRMLRGVLGAVDEGWSCAITPDGPRGPRYSVQPGFILLARRSGLPLHPLGIAVDRAWVLKSWDAFCLPKPGARIVIVVAPPMEGDDFRGRPIEEMCAELKGRIETATEEAEAELAAW